jgi:hypothetical protein
MLWLHPRLVGRVGFDTRMEQYTQSELAGYFAFVLVEGPRWLAAARGYEMAAVSACDSRMMTALARSPGWSAAFRDHDGAVFVRSGISSAAPGR